MKKESDNKEEKEIKQGSENTKAKEAPVIGLTGGIGSGKSTAAAYLASKGMIHIDADAISRRMTEKVPGQANPVLEEIGRAFQTKGGESAVLREDGSLDRAAMAGIVFRDPHKKRVLEGILFGRIKEEIRREIREARKALQEGTCRGILLDVPLLFETGLDSLCDQIIVVTADHEVRLRRVAERDDCTYEDVEARIRSQMPEEEKILRADYVVDNSWDRSQLESNLDGILARMLSRMSE